MTTHIYKYPEDIKISDKHIEDMFTQMEEDGTVQVVFYEGTIQTKEEFLALAQNTNNHFYFLLVDKTIVGFTWLNRFEGKMAHLHFCFFKKYKSSCVQIGKQVLDYLFSFMHDGQYCFGALVGFVPEWNTSAIQYAKYLGATVAARIPDAIYNSATEVSEPAYFIYYTRIIE